MQHLQSVVPWAYVAVFCVAFAIASRIDVSRLLLKLHAFLIARKFTQSTDLEGELLRINLLRILTGVVLLHRTWLIWLYARDLPMTDYQLALLYLVLLLAGLLTLGVVTPVSTLILFLVHDYAFDDAMRTSTLGSDVLQMLLMVFLFLPVGTMLSVDARLLRSPGPAGDVVRSLYRVIGQPSLEKASLLRFAAFLSFGMMSLYAALTHVHDVSWRTGLANVYVLGSSYMSKAYGAVELVLQAAPQLVVLFSMISIFGQMLWEVAMIPLVFQRYGKLYVVLWGVVFFLISAFVLQLGWLAYYEMILWALLFWQWPKYATCIGRVRSYAATLSSRFWRHASAFRSNDWRQPTASARAADAPPTSFKIQRAFGAFVLSYTILLGLYTIYLPEVSALPAIRNVVSNADVASVYRVAQLYGLTPINVFNDVDLQMSENYFTITRVGADGSRVLLPLTGIDGNRLEWHDSDRMYFGNSLQWRRLRLTRPERCYDKDVDSWVVGELVYVDRRRHGNLAAYYELQYYHRPLPALELLQRGTYVAPPTIHVCTVIYDPDSSAVQIIPGPGLGGERAPPPAAADQRSSYRRGVPHRQTALSGAEGADRLHHVLLVVV
jgi:hypothetical protein